MIYNDKAYAKTVGVFEGSNPKIQYTIGDDYGYYFNDVSISERGHLRVIETSGDGFKIITFDEQIGKTYQVKEIRNLEFVFPLIFYVRGTREMWV